MTLQAYWIKRASELKHDNWRTRVCNLNSSGPLAVTQNDAMECGEILRGIIKNFIAFRTRYGTVKNNFLSVPIIDNENFYYCRGREHILLSRQFFFGTGRVTSDRLDGLTWTAITNNFVLQDRQAVNALLGLELSIERYRDLKNCFDRAKKKFYSDNDTFLPIAEFFSGIKKGSGTKKLRTVLYLTKTGSTKKKCPIVTYARTLDIPDPEPSVCKNLNSRWNKNYYGSEIRTFLFKLYHNTLGINSRVHHYNAERSPACSFCSLAKNLPAEKETILHVFWYCPSVHQCLVNTLNCVVKTRTTLKNFFLGTDDSDRHNEVLILIYDTLKYIIWLHKLRKKLPTTHSLTNDLFYYVNIFAGSNSKLNGKINGCKFLRRNRDE
jgi:hypothetical protein